MSLADLRGGGLYIILFVKRQATHPLPTIFTGAFTFTTLLNPEAANTTIWVLQEVG